MDDIDRAQAAQQIATDAAIRAAAQRRNIKPPAASKDCLNCGEPLSDGQRFCDADCRDDHMRRQAKQENDRVLRRLA
jgi:predicted nucleic acid-binding Zn ribbon protein